jgi:hypothetical protein
MVAWWVGWPTDVGVSNDLALRTPSIANSVSTVAHPLPAEQHQPIKVPLQQIIRTCIFPKDLSDE